MYFIFKTSSRAGANTPPQLTVSFLRWFYTVNTHTQLWVFSQMYNDI